MKGSKKTKQNKTSLRMTRQRKIIHEELKKLKTHPTADEIYKLVKKKLPNISLGTVYRNLDIMVECGNVRRLEFGGIHRRYDGQMHEHYHVRCVNCDRIEDIPSKSININVDTVKSTCGFVIVGHDLEFYGLCRHCQSSS